MSSENTNEIWVGVVEIGARDPKSLEGSAGGYLTVAARARDEAGYCERASYWLAEHGFFVKNVDELETFDILSRNDAIEGNISQQIIEEMGTSANPGKYDVWFGEIHCYEKSDG